mmetsp:Transcript_128271/g.256188  ORF Transcript_128271/g.256188 Transcript_128271/m.256188 type:complete len:246 (+) Transcript_128271:3-740(+)
MQLLPSGRWRGSPCHDLSFGGPGSSRLLQTRYAVSGQQELDTAVPPASNEREVEQRKAKLNADELQWETQKFNLLWTKMQEAKEQRSPKYADLKKEVEIQGKVVEDLGGSLPAEMLTQEQAAEKAAKLKKDLALDKVLQMSNEERWTLAQGLGPAFPVSLVLSYTLYWVLNVPFIAYAYFTTVVTGQTSMPVVMAAAYATSIPFKPLIYIGGLLGTLWTSDNVMPLLAKFFSYFRLPDADDWDRV